MIDTSRSQEALSAPNRNVGGFELPAPGLWDIPSGWASIEISVPRIFGSSLRTGMRLKQGTIAIADEPTHSTAQLSLDASSLRTGDGARDRYLHEVLDTGRYATIPVRIASLEHRVGPNWKADGWITVGEVSTPIELDITYHGLVRHGSAAHFSARANVPLRSILTGSNRVKSRFLSTRHLRIAIEVHAAPFRAPNLSSIECFRTPRMRSKHSDGLLGGDRPLSG
jgi:polyisoprenoid-binding protein YceI